MGNYLIGTGAVACLWKYITVFYHKVGLNNAQIGVIQLLNPTVGFIAQLIWAAICDRLGTFKRVLVLSNLCGITLIHGLLVTEVQKCFPALCLVVLTAQF